jgi:type I restriction enzyme M protein
VTRQGFRAIRASLDLTQEQLATRFGMKRNTITRWEAGILPLPKIAVWAIKGLLAEERGTLDRRARG